MNPRRALRAFGNGALGRIGPSVAAGLIRLTDSTTRWTWEGAPVFQAALEQRQPVIIAFWHSRILMMCPRLEDIEMPLRVLVSNNRDGELISRVVQKFGHDTIRGSTRNPKKTKQKGGGAALREMLRHIEKGGSAAITPDGPRGPARMAQVGASVLSAQSGVPVLPVACATNRGPALRSWDRFRLSLPFAKGAYVVGEPMPIPERGDNAIEAHRMALEQALNTLTDRADALVGRTE